MGDGDLPYEAEDFYEDILHSQLNGLKTACFGSGDHAYPKFCEAVTLFCDAFEQAGANLYPETLKIELAPETAEDQECSQRICPRFSCMGRSPRRQVPCFIKARRLSWHQYLRDFCGCERRRYFSFSAEEGWKRLFRVKSRIHVLTYIGPYIFAAGEKAPSSDQPIRKDLDGLPVSDQRLRMGRCRAE